MICSRFEPLALHIGAGLHRGDDVKLVELVTAAFSDVRFTMPAAAGMVKRTSLKAAFSITSGLCEQTTSPT